MLLLATAEAKVKVFL